MFNDFRSKFMKKIRLIIKNEFFRVDAQRNRHKKTMCIIFKKTQFRFRKIE